MEKINVDETLGYISGCMQRIHNNIYDITREMNETELRTLISYLLEAQQRKEQETLKQIYESNNAGLAENYAGITSNYINEMNSSVESILVQRNQTIEPSDNSKMFL